MPILDQCSSLNLKSIALAKKIEQLDKTLLLSHEGDKIIDECNAINLNYDRLINEIKSSGTSKEKSKLADIHYDWATHLHQTCIHLYKRYEQSHSATHLTQAFEQSQQRLDKILEAERLYQETLSHSSAASSSSSHKRKRTPQNDLTITQEVVKEYKSYHSWLTTERDKPKETQATESARMIRLIEACAGELEKHYTEFGQLNTEIKTALDHFSTSMGRLHPSPSAAIVSPLSLFSVDHERAFFQSLQNSSSLNAFEPR